MGMPDYSEFDGLGLAELVAKRAVTPLELVEAAGRQEGPEGEHDGLLAAPQSSHRGQIH